jgi:hypothetical protein
VHCMPPAIPAILLPLEFVRGILLIFHTRIVPVFAFCALE